ncbi:envelope stress response membrane protein PspC [Aliidiomarina sedimenti]|uniref:Envelope stress response membrane protein PspC n=2 Tax=Aliidiomarina TaxID=1249554 RepID=A0A432WLS4_9GAMM|nr:MULTISPECIES: envelope stress response membrane protein PspC [Aliidiomarina]RUO31938.1 envelope stress response membrane protein PspC [Aliidiomarina sedimenti]RUO34766.1 envelope stress response membrane protein PspC [Aliidiomarina soli]
MSDEKKRFYRDVQRGKLGGVCAGIARYFGWEVWVVRIVAVTSALLLTKFIVLGYIIAWVVLDQGPKSASGEPRVVRETTTVERTEDGRSIEVKTRVWEAGEVPKEAIKDIAGRFATMEQSVRAMESYVTSSEYKVRQEINRL